jgi:hypothetical protein
MEDAVSNGINAGMESGDAPAKVLIPPSRANGTSARMGNRRKSVMGGGAIPGGNNALMNSSSNAGATAAERALEAT